MDKFFVCLANSYKHGGRCVAGIELEWRENRWRIVRDERNMPKWVRPVSRETPTGEIHNDLAKGIRVLDVVLLKEAVPCGQGAQRENCYFEGMAPIGKHYGLSTQLLERFTDTSHKHLFYNCGKAVSPEIFQREGSYSILLTKATNAEVYIDTSFTDYPRYRVCFAYLGHAYDFPVTDPDYIRALTLKKKGVGLKETLYITCSLGLEHEGLHYKLAATIFDLALKEEKDVDADWFESYEDELKLLMEKKEVIESRITALRLEIKQKMEKSVLSKVNSQHFTISYSPACTVTRFDTKLFKEEHSDLYNSYCKQTQKEAVIVIKRKRRNIEQKETDN